MKKIVDADIDDWTSEKLFDNKWIKFFNEKLSVYFDTNWFNPVSGWKLWIEIEPNEQNPTEPKFYCR